MKLKLYFSSFHTGIEAKCVGVERGERKEREKEEKNFQQAEASGQIRTQGGRLSDSICQVESERERGGG